MLQDDGCSVLFSTFEVLLHFSLAGIVSVQKSVVLLSSLFGLFMRFLSLSLVLSNLVMICFGNFLLVAVFRFIELLGSMGLIILIKFRKTSAIFLHFVFAPSPQPPTFRGFNGIFYAARSYPTAHWCSGFFFFPVFSLCVSFGIVSVAMSSGSFSLQCLIFYSSCPVCSKNSRCCNFHLWKFIWVFIATLLNTRAVIIIVLGSYLWILLVSLLHLPNMGHIFLSLFMSVNFLVF